jgi:uncharacterized protein YjbJ (UPF0337 family)
MNADMLKGKWHQFKGDVKSQWAKLTNDDIAYIEGNTEKLIGKVQERYGCAREEARREVDTFLNRHEAHQPS